MLCKFRMNVEMKDKMMDPPIPKTTISKVTCAWCFVLQSYVSVRLQCFPHVAPRPHCPNLPGFWKGKAQEVCNRAEIRFFFFFLFSLTSPGFSAHWNNYNFSRALMFLFFTLHRRGRVFPGEKGAERKPESKGHRGIHLSCTSTAGYDESSYGWY